MKLHFFLLPVFSFIVIENHPLFNDLKSRFHIMNSLESAFEKEVMSAVKKSQRILKSKKL